MKRSLLDGMPKLVLGGEAVRGLILPPEAHNKIGHLDTKHRRNLTHLSQTLQPILVCRGQTCRIINGTHKNPPPITLTLTPHLALREGCNHLRHLSSLWQIRTPYNQPSHPTFNHQSSPSLISKLDTKQRGILIQRLYQTRELVTCHRVPVTCHMAMVSYHHLHPNMAR